MTFKEAAMRIEDHMEVHDLAEKPHAVKITEALEMAIKLLLWMDQQPDFILEGNILDLLDEYYNDGLREGFRRAKRVYKVKDEKCEHEWEFINTYSESFNTVNRYKCSKCGKAADISIGI